MIVPHHNLDRSIHKAIADPALQAILSRFPHERTQRVRAALADLPDAKTLRQHAARIRQYSLEHLDSLIPRFADNVRQRGGHVHFAADAADACQIVTTIARNASAKRGVKTKSMTTEEIQLAHALEAAGVHTLETDLGEFIVQLDNDRPSHIITPMIHKPRSDVARLFQQKLHAICTDDPADLTATARQHLRSAFRHADMAVVGANFAIADTGSVAILTNEGNGRFAAARPPLLVAVLGLEKIIPSLPDLALLLKLTVRAAVGQPLTVYANLISGPATPDEPDGPRDFHIIIVDNGRSKLLASPTDRQLLRCLRCGACLNACPVYTKIGGHAYGATYPGPIGATLTPRLTDFAAHSDQLCELSSLCGACRQACPVDIDIPRLLIDHRRLRATTHRLSFFWRFGLAAWRWTFAGPRRYRLSQRALRLALLPLARRGWIRLPRFLRPFAAWTRTRDLPLPPRESFRTLYKNSQGKL